MDHWIILIISLLLSAFFSGIEIAFFSSNKLRIELDRQKGLLSGKVFSKFLQHPSSLMATLLIGNNIALVIFGISAAALITPTIHPLTSATIQAEGLQMFIQTILATAVILITAEFIPKVLFRINPNGVLHLFAVPCHRVSLSVFSCGKTVHPDIQIDDEAVPSVSDLMMKSMPSATWILKTI
jgi:putative hemolysin